MPEQDPCQCTDGFGWDSTTMMCAEGRTTRCWECTTLPGCIQNSCSTSDCPEFGELLTCQCNDMCGEFGNCCEDVDVCTKVETTTAPVTTAPLCGNGMCDDGEDLICPTDCPDEVTAAVCQCVVEADMCGMTCPAISSLTGDCLAYGIAGICGMVIDIDAEYYDVCDACVRPTEAETTEAETTTSAAGCDVMDLSSMGRLLERPYTEARFDKVGRRAREIILLKDEMNYDDEALDAMYNIRRFWKNQEPSEFYWNKMINNYNKALETECAVSEVGIVANIEA